MTRHGLTCIVMGMGVACGNSAIEPPGDTGGNELTGRWAVESALPEGRFAFGAATYRDQLYVVAGSDEPGASTYGDPTDDVVRFDPATGAWETLNPFPEPLVFPLAAVAGDTLYAAGGLFNIPGGLTEARATLYAYLPDTDTWELRAPMPRARFDAAGAGLDGRLVVTGGTGEDRVSIARGAAVYDPGTGRWDSIPSPAIQRTGARAVTSGNLLYLMGGGITTSILEDPVARIETFDLTTNTWSTYSVEAPAALGMTMAAVNGMIHLAGGRATGANPSDRHWVLDLATATWTEYQSLPEGRTRAGSVGLMGSYYVIGGTEFGPNGTTASPDAVRFVF